MKKILLVAVIALVAIGASAVTRPQHAPRATFVKDQKARFAALSKVRNLETNFNAQKASFGIKQNAKINVSNFKPFRRAGEVEKELIPTYSEFALQYGGETIGGFAQRNMYDGASYLVDGDKAYFNPFSIPGYLEGERDDANNPFAEIGAVAYKFTAAPVITYDDKINPAIDLSIEPCIVDETETSFTATRSTEKTFYGYYLAETGEFYFPDCLALFDYNSTDTQVWSLYYTVWELDLLPQEIMKPYIVKGTFIGDSFYTNVDANSGECEIFVGYEDVWYVKGANGTNGMFGELDFGKDSWIEYDFDEDLTTATVDYLQYIELVEMYTDETYTTTENAMLVTYGADIDAVAGRAATTRYSKYKLTENIDGTTTLSNTDNTAFVDFMLFESGDPDFGNIIDLSINITWELAYPDAGGDDTAIKGVKSEKVNANGTYNLNGQRVNDNAKGLIIKDGKKVIMK